MKIKNYSIIVLCFAVLVLLFASNVLGSRDDFFVIDPEAFYDEDSPNIVIEVSGYKLDVESVLAGSLANVESLDVQRIDPEILEISEKYIEYRRIEYSSLDEFGPCHIYSAKDLGNYVLVYFDEPEIMDGGFELVYSKKLKKFIGQFVAGYRG